jgi:hypothetical protein
LLGEVEALVLELGDEVAARLRRRPGASMEMLSQMVRTWSSIPNCSPTSASMYLRGSSA